MLDGLVVPYLLLLSLHEMKANPRGVCKDQSIFNTSVAFFDSMMNLRNAIRHDSSLFFSLDGATLYTDST